jgi:hypothetical protein
MELEVLIITPANKLVLDGLNQTNPLKHEQQLYALELIDGNYILLQDLLTDLNYWSHYQNFLLSLIKEIISSEQIKQNVE